MPDPVTILVVSDIHFAGAAEKQRGQFESHAIANPVLRLLVRFYRRYFWLRDPFAHNHLLDQVLNSRPSPDWVIGNGDYSCDSAFVGVSDPAALQSAAECLAKLRGQFGHRFHPTMGDHELGKLSLFGGRGGMRLASWHSARNNLQIQPFWKFQIGRYTLLGITSSLVALPIFEPETLPNERPEWHKLRTHHLQEITNAFENIQAHERILFFCHDPTALPFLAELPSIQARFPQFEATIIGHLHTPLILWKTRFLAGMPPLGFLGNSIRRMSVALHNAKLWRPFRVKLCPALAGIELLKDGAYLTANLDPEANSPARFRLHPTRANPRSPLPTGELYP